MKAGASITVCVLAGFILLYTLLSLLVLIQPSQLDANQIVNKTSLRAVPASLTKPGTYQDLQGAHSFLASFLDPKANGLKLKLPVEGIQHEEFGQKSNTDSPQAQCRHVVEMLTRNS